MSDTYVVRKTRKKDTWDISKFSDYKDADSMFTVSKRGTTYSCDCPGFWRQKDKSEHKHCKIVKFWKENLEETDGYAFWLEGDDIEYNHFMPTNSFVK
jgi:hypothetical protein